MKTLKIKVYEYHELSDKAKEKARQWYLDGEDFSFVWDGVKDDAKNIGLDLQAWDYGRYAKGEFITSANECAENIIKDHGDMCDTYKTAKAYLDSIKPYYDRCTDEMTADEEKKYTELQDEFLRGILEDYRVMMDKDVDYQQSEEAIAETMKANGYTFTADGKRMG